MVDVLETGDVPILFSLPQMKKIWVMTLDLDQQKQNYMFSFWLVFFSSGVLHNGTYRVGSDEPYVSANNQVE